MSDVRVRAALLGALACAGVFGAGGVAGAQPVSEVPPPPPPAPAPPPAAVTSPLAQAGQPGGPAGMPIAGPTGTEMLLGQNPVPAAPCAAPGTPPNLNALNGGYLLPQNTEPAAPGDGAVAGVTPGQENADLGRLDYLRRLHGMYREGNLKGALLGRVPKEQLSEPFPGTAPPPGTALPPGLGGPPAASVPPPPTPAEVPPGPQAPPLTP
ncbi:hypothetical protein AB0K11_08730 [Mycobacterium sp. NPDC050551]|uniref:hypothetical protein n=1 Tax=Mycobacterium sp. NPDC050551 TaxID=3155407 RepID=UPI003448A336